MIRAILLICLIAFAHTMAYEDEVMEDRAALGCITDTECELGIYEDDPEVTEQLKGVE